MRHFTRKVASTVANRMKSRVKIWTKSYAKIRYTGSLHIETIFVNSIKSLFGMKKAFTDCRKIHDCKTFIKEIPVFFRILEVYSK